MYGSRSNERVGGNMNEFKAVEPLPEIKRHDQRRSRLGIMSMMMAQTLGNVYGMSNRQHTPHYIEYSGIPSEEQKLKSAERKARKRARKEK
jgi:hypothetical protein